MDDYDIVDGDFKEYKWEEDLKKLNSKGLNNRSVLINLLEQLGTAEKVVQYLSVSPQNNPRSVEQEESPEGVPLLTPHESPIVDNYFNSSGERLGIVQDDFIMLVEEPAEDGEEEMPSSPEPEPPAPRVLSEQKPLIKPPPIVLDGQSVRAQQNNILGTLETMSPVTPKNFRYIGSPRQKIKDMSASVMLSSPLQELVRPLKRRGSEPDLACSDIFQLDGSPRAHNLYRPFSLRPPTVSRFSSAPSPPTVENPMLPSRESTPGTVNLLEETSTEDLKILEQTALKLEASMCEAVNIKDERSYDVEINEPINLVPLDNPGMLIEKEQLLQCMCDSVNILPQRTKKSQPKSKRRKLGFKKFNVHKRSLLKTRPYRKGSQIRVYIKFTDFFLAMVLTTFVWWTYKEISRLRDSLAECEQIVQNINSTHSSDFSSVD